MGCGKHSNWVRGNEGSVHHALKQALGTTTIALIVLKIGDDDQAWRGPSTRPVAVVLFKAQEDCEFAAAIQPGSRYSNVLQNLWMSLPAFPLPQYFSFLELQTPADNARAVFAELRKYGEIGHFAWRKASVDLRSEDDKERDQDEEAELDIPPR
jgi:hypothetical protein